MARIARFGVPLVLLALVLPVLPPIVMASESLATLRGRLVAPNGDPVAGAVVTATPDPAGTPVTAISGPAGEYQLALSAGTWNLRISAEGFAETSRPLKLTAGAATIAEVTLEVVGLQELVTVDAAVGYTVPAVSSATKTLTPLRDVPQAVSIVTSELIEDQRMTSMADVTRYMPGVGIAQGEGNRDTPILRGNSTTVDFFVDGVREDVQYFRDVYNVDRVEALKGPNAMIFGRGGAGGVLNRVTRQADWGEPHREATLQLGSWSNERLTADVGRGLNEATALRVTGLYEDSDSYRDGVELERYGVNPTAAFRLGEDTTLRAGFEYFRDERTADRGISSFRGRPVVTDSSTFFGDPAKSHSEATVHLLSGSLEHRFSERVTLRNRLSYGDYDKFYQNVFPGAVDAAGTTVAIQAYNNATTRENLFNQTDLIVSAQSGRIAHTLLFGVEVGLQDTSSARLTGYFTGLGSDVTTFDAPLEAPTISAPVEFRQSATDADNDSETTIAALYAQDQLALSERFDAVVGLRFDNFDVEVDNHRTGTRLRSDDGLLSPRLGLIYKPFELLSVYGSYSLTYLPRAGEQLSSLSPTNQTLDPEEFTNYEVGAKWDLAHSFALTAAAYRLDRGNVAVPDPNDPTVSILVDAQRTKGIEVGVNGHVTEAWSVAGGYAYQDGEITRSISSTAQAGASLAQLPKHSISLWNRVDITPRVAAALGLLYRDEVFTSTDNLVVLPDWTRVDAAVFYTVNAMWKAQLNVENLLDEEYHPYAQNNTNITPGSPRALRFALTTHF